MPDNEMSFRVWADMLYSALSDDPKVPPPARQKQPDEIVPAGQWGIDFAPDPAMDGSISSATARVRECDGADVIRALRSFDGVDVTSAITSGIAIINGTEVSIALRGGTDGKAYIVEFDIVTENGTALRAGFAFLVADLGEETE